MEGTPLRLRAFNQSKHPRWQAMGVAVAGGVLGPALFVIPALANNGANDAPVANADTFTISQNIAQTLAVLANDTDPNGDTLSIASVSSPAHGTIGLAAGVITYTPAAGYLGADTFNYTVSDGHDNTSTAAVTLTVSNTNGVPTAQNESIAVLANTATVLTPLSNDTDPEGDTLSISAVGTAAHGMANLTAGVLTYIPNAGYTGSDSFTYTISDGHGNTSTATVTLLVSATIGVPVAQDDSLNVAMDVATPINVFANDSDPDGHALTITGVSTPLHGTASIVGGTSITYTPTAGYIGTDILIYTVSDGFGSTDTATVTLNVGTTNNGPAVQNDAINVVLNTSTTLDVLGNDSDPNGDALTITSVTAPMHGTAVVATGSTSVTYTPVAGYIGGDVFSYTVSDGNGNTASGTVTVTVVAAGNLLAKNDFAMTKKETAIQINVLANDRSNGALSVGSVGAPAHGSVVINADGTITYTPAADFKGVDAFSYTAVEAGGATATATVTVIVHKQHEDNGNHNGWFKNGLFPIGLIRDWCGFGDNSDAKHDKGDKDRGSSNVSNSQGKDHKDKDDDKPKAIATVDQAKIIRDKQEAEKRESDRRDAEKREIEKRNSDKRDDHDSKKGNGAEIRTSIKASLSGQGKHGR